MNARSSHIPFDHHFIRSIPITRNLPALDEKNSEFDRFVILSPPLRGLEMTLQPRLGKQQWTLGSSSGVDFYVRDPSLLDVHLIIEQADCNWMIHCHRKCWGMLVNLEPVQMAVIEDGDRIIVGRFELVFVEASVVSEQ